MTTMHNELKCGKCSSLAGDRENSAKINGFWIFLHSTDASLKPPYSIKNYKKIYILGFDKATQ